MELKSKLIVSYLKMKVLYRVVIQRLGLVQLESHPREYYVEIVKSLKSGLKRKDVLLREIESFRYEIATSGTLAL